MRAAAATVVLGMFGVLVSAGCGGSVGDASHRAESAPAPASHPILPGGALPARAPSLPPGAQPIPLPAGPPVRSLPVPVDTVKSVPVPPGTVRQIPVPPGTVQQIPVPPGTVQRIPVPPGIVQTISSDMVWANTETRIFYQRGDPAFLKSQPGRLIPKATALAGGYREAKTGNETPRPE